MGARAYDAIVVGAIGDDGASTGHTSAYGPHGDRADRRRGVLPLIYYRLARREEREAEAQFGDAYRAYRARVPMFVPRLTRASEPRWSER